MDTGNSGTCGDVRPITTKNRRIERYFWTKAKIDVAARGNSSRSFIVGQNDGQVAANVDIAIELCDLDFPEVAPDIDVAVEDAAKPDNASEVPRHRNSSVDVISVGAKRVIRWRRDDTVNRDTADRFGRDVTEVDEAGHRVVAFCVKIGVGRNRVDAVKPARFAGCQADAAKNVGDRKVDVCHHHGIDAEVAKTSGNSGRSAGVGGLRVGNNRADVGVAGGPEGAAGGRLRRGGDAGRGDGDGEAVFRGETNEVDFVHIETITQIGDLEPGATGRLAGDFDRDTVAVGIGERKILQHTGAIGQAGKKDTGLEGFELSRRGHGGGGNDGDLGGAAA